MAELFDIVLRHQIYLEGLKRGRNADFPKVLGKLDNALRTNLANIEYSSLGDASKKQLNSLLVALRKAMRVIFDPWLKILTEWLERYMKIEVEAFNAYFGGSADPDKVLAASKTEPMPTGVFWLPFLRGSTTYAMSRIEKLVVVGYVNQMSKDDVIKSFLGTKSNNYKDGIGRLLDNSTSAAISTVMQHLSAQAAFNVGQSVAGGAIGNRVLTGQYEWVSVLDDATTEICRSRDGKRYQYGSGPVPPAHVRCRSTTVPVFEGVKWPDTSFAMWASQQSQAFINDAFDGKAPSRYEGSKALTLDEYEAKRSLILS